MVPIRVLIVDDAVVVRRLLSDIIAKDRMLEVVGTAANGKIALDKIPILKPHVIVLDLEMPVMDGLQTLDALKKLRLGIPVIAFSATTLRGAKSTFEALAKGRSTMSPSLHLSRKIVLSLKLLNSNSFLVSRHLVESG